MFARKILLPLFTVSILLASCEARYPARETSVICDSCELTIPKVIHQIWHEFPNGSKYPPAEQAEFAKELQRKHPGWKYMLWDNQNSRDFVKQYYPDFLSTYDSYNSPIKRANALRYLLLNYFGGMYLDMSFKGIKNLEPLLKGANFVAAAQDPSTHLLNSAWLASTPNHPILLQLIADLKGHANENLRNATGSQILTEEVNSYLKKYPKEKGAKIYQNNFIYPFRPSQKNDLTPTKCRKNTEHCEILYPNAYLIKFWGNNN